MKFNVRHGVGHLPLFYLYLACLPMQEAEVEVEVRA